MFETSESLGMKECDFPGRLDVAIWVLLTERASANGKANPGLSETDGV